MKDKILKLRVEGHSYRAIEAQLGCSKSLISYYCGDGQIKKTRDRTAKRRKESPVENRFEFKSYAFNNKISQFRDKERKTEASLTPAQAREIFIEQQGKCYLTGIPLDFTESKEIHFDHKIPISKGGSSTKENLGICSRQANLAKSSMTVHEFLNFCKQVLEYHGYTITN